MKKREVLRLEKTIFGFLYREFDLQTAISDEFLKQMAFQEPYDKKNLTEIYSLFIKASSNYQNKMCNIFKQVLELLTEDNIK